MNIDKAGSAEILVTVRLHIHSLEDANFRTTEPFVSHTILRVTDSQGFLYQYFACTSNCISFFVMSFCGSLSNGLWPWENSNCISECLIKVWKGYLDLKPRKKRQGWGNHICKFQLPCNVTRMVTVREIRWTGYLSFCTATKLYLKNLRICVFKRLGRHQA
jgi:hypothetical protein